MELTINEIILAVNGVVISGIIDNDVVIKNVFTDSRKLASDNANTSVFVGIKGERFDGNTFAAFAISMGTAVVIIDNKSSIEGLVFDNQNTLVILVTDSLKAFGAIAGAWRNKLNSKFVAITGSVGKTTTKEFVYKVVSDSFVAVKTPENHNNEIGVPETILGIGKNTEIAVIEMGMRGFHQIEYLRRIALPKIAVITNIGCAHLEIMGTKENTLRAKLEIAENMTEDDILILNGDDELLSNKEKVSAVLKEKNANPRIIYFGMNENNDVCGGEVSLSSERTEFNMSAFGESKKITLNAPGIHIVYAALAAAVVGISLGISLEEIQKSVCDITNKTLGRQEVKKNKEITIIDDCYNAGPESVKSSLSILSAMEGKRKVAFLGDMLELGDYSFSSHLEVGKFAAESGVKLLVCVGELSKKIGEGAISNAAFQDGEVLYFGDSEIASNVVKDILTKGDVCLVKGSHAMKMGNITNAIMAL